VWLPALRTLTAVKSVFLASGLCEPFILAPLELLILQWRFGVLGAEGALNCITNIGHLAHAVIKERSAVDSDIYMLAQQATILTVMREWKLRSTPWDAEREKRFLESFVGKFSGLNTENFTSACESLRVGQNAGVPDALRSALLACALQASARERCTSRLTTGNCVSESSGSGE